MDSIPSCSLLNLHAGSVVLGDVDAAADIGDRALRRSQSECYPAHALHSIAARACAATAMCWSLDRDPLIFTDHDPTPRAPRLSVPAAVGELIPDPGNEAILRRDEQFGRAS
jgi:hypothetical protein